MGLQAVGIEFAKQRFDLACDAASNISDHLRTFGLPAGASTRLQFAHGSFTELEFSEADILFMDSQMFEPALLKQIGEHARALKKGTRIITIYPLPGLDYKILWTGYVPCSWTRVLWSVQEKLTEAIPAAAAPLRLSKADRICGLP